MKQQYADGWELKRETKNNSNDNSNNKKVNQMWSICRENDSLDLKLINVIH